MSLMNTKLEKHFAEVGRQDDKRENALVIAKFFTPDSSWAWLATEYYPETREFFGLVIGFETELGYFSLDELESVRGNLGLPIERELHWTEITISESRKNHTTQQTM